MNHFNLIFRLIFCIVLTQSTVLTELQHSSLQNIETGLISAPITAQPVSIAQPTDHVTPEQQTKKTWDDLPQRTQGFISGSIGRDQTQYHAQTHSDQIMRLQNTGVMVEFDKQRVWVKMGGQSIGLRLTGYDALNVPISNNEGGFIASPRADLNRVSYDYGIVSEWYENGPAGLQHGFTLYEPPMAGAEMIRLRMAVTDANARLDADARGLTFESNNGAHTRYTGLLAFDADGRDLPVRFEADTDGHGFSILLDTHQASYPLTVDPFFQGAKLINLIDPDKRFGSSVAMSGDVIVVGAPYADEAYENQGVAYVFIGQTTEWSAKLKASDGRLNDYFGTGYLGRVAIDGNVIVIGVEQHAVGTNINQGVAYVFVKPVNGWTGTQTESAKLIASDGMAEDRFAHSVSVSGDVIVIGQFRSGPDGNSDRHLAYVFTKPLTGWVGTLNENAKLIPDIVMPINDFARSVVINEDVVVVTGAESQTVYVYVRPIGGWVGNLTKNAKLIENQQLNGSVSSGFGQVFDISGDVIVVGAPNLNYEQGAAYIFVKPAGGWAGTLTETAKLLKNNGSSYDGVGLAVAISGDVVAIGAADTYDVIYNIHPYQGPIYVFIKPIGGWAGILTQNARLQTNNDLTNNYFSGVIDISGDTIVVGMPFYQRAASITTYDGAISIFTKPNTGWAGQINKTQQLVVDDVPSVPFTGSVAVSGDVIVVGSAYENNENGVVYVYVKPISGWNGTLVQSAKLVVSDGAWQDRLGLNVAVSGDVIVASATGVDIGANPNQGAAYIFVKPATGWGGGDL